MHPEVCQPRKDSKATVEFTVEEVFRKEQVGWILSEGQ